MVDIILKLAQPEFDIGTSANTLNNSVLFRVFAPSTSKVTVSDDTNTEIGSITIPGGFVEIIEKRRTDLVSATPAVKCTPIAYK